MMRFIIVDDDLSVRKILSNLIEKYQLGEVVGECGDGLEAENLVAAVKPDIALVDLLLPGQDGVELVKKLSAHHTGTSFIMISQSSNQPMITQAYQSGIDFYIHKPINVLEVTSIIKKVEESRHLKQVMSMISQTTARFGAAASRPAEPDENQQRTKIYRIFSDLGIIGEAGAKNIHQMTSLVADTVRNGSEQTYQLHDIYQPLAEKIQQDVKTIEQRVRRTIAKALQNVANMGIEDYGSDKFQMYSTALFDFKEIRQEMHYIQGKSAYRGKINIRKFIEGLLFLANE